MPLLRYPKLLEPNDVVGDHLIRRLDRRDLGGKRAGLVHEESGGNTVRRGAGLTDTRYLMASF
jgi:hypothetical protein